MNHVRSNLSSIPMLVPRRRRRTALRANPTLEGLEQRALLTTFNIKSDDTATLINTIAYLNQTGGTNTINLNHNNVAQSAYVFLNTYNDTESASDALPPIGSTGGGVLTINGNGTILDAQSSIWFRLLEIDSGANVQINDLTIEGGGVDSAYNRDAVGGGIFVAGGDVTLTDVTVTANFAEDDNPSLSDHFASGAGIFVNDGGAVSLIDCTVSHNTAQGFNAGSTGEAGGIAGGGGLGDVGSTVTISDGTTFLANAATGGAGSNGTAGTVGTAGKFTAPNGGNGGPGQAATAGGLAEGGGLYATDGQGTAVVTINNATFSGNLAIGGTGGTGGAGGTGGQGYGNFFATNSGGNGGNGAAGAVGGGASGGGLFVQTASAVIAGSTFSSNSSLGGAGGGGGLGMYVSISGHRVAGHSGHGGNGGNGGNGALGGAGGAGGIYNSLGTITPTNSTLAFNTASAGEGGAAGAAGPYGWGGGTGGGHSAASKIGLSGAGGVGASGGSASGGGMYTVTGGTTLVNDTVADNSVSAGSGQGAGGLGSATGGGLSISGSSTVTIANLLIAKNIQTGGDIDGTVTSLGHNLVGVVDSNTIGLVSSDLTGNVYSPENPGLSTTLADNGGPTQTLALLVGSPAIDAGSNALAVGPGGASLLFDQRGAGYSRIVGGTVDIGAYQADPAMQIASGSGQIVATNTNFASALSVEVTLGGEPDPNVSVTFTAPQIGIGGTFATGGMFIVKVLTNSSGIADAGYFTANNSVGSYTVTASIAGGASESFNLTNGNATTVSSVSGSGVQNGSATLTALLEQSSNHANLAGETIAFELNGNAVGAATTNQSGVATLKVTLGSLAAGTDDVTATFAGTGFDAGSTAAGTLTVAAYGSPSKINASQGTPQSAVVGTTFATPLEATVLDALGNLVPNVTVTFTAPANAASGTFGSSKTSTYTATTNSRGIAEAASFTANGTTGSDTVKASIPGNVSTSFNLTNTYETSITDVSGSGVHDGSATLTAELERTSTGANLSGQTITFALDGKSVGSSLTNSAGVATFSAGLGSLVAGTYTSDVTATFAGAGPSGGSTATGTLTVLLYGPPAQISVKAGAPQSAVIGTAFATAMEVESHGRRGQRGARCDRHLLCPDLGRQRHLRERFNYDQGEHQQVRFRQREQLPCQRHDRHLFGHGLDCE